ncbi:MAG: GHKL domain-containing protein [Polyangiaceae bacterium]|nr:GHKL domain-containing protein [Polyangiaceae bacterium]
MAALGLLAVAPWLTAREASAMLDGTALELDLAGSLRFRLLELERRAEGAPSDDVRTFEQQLREQRALLVLLRKGDPTRHVARCPTSELCRRLDEHLARWDGELGPGLREAARAESVPRALLTSIGTEVTRLDGTVHLLAAAIQSQAEAARQLGMWATLAALGLVGLVGFGVWDVFGRIRRVRDAASEGAEAVLVAEAGEGTEIGHLSRALAIAAREAREHRRRDRRRLSELSAQQLAVRRTVAALGDWMGHRHDLDAVLEQIAGVAGYGRAELASPGAVPEVGEGDVSLELHHAGGDLGTLVLRERQYPKPPNEEQDVLLDTLGQVLTIALVAARTLELGEVRGELSAALASASSVHGAAPWLGSAIRRMVDYEEAVVELLDARGRVEERIDVSAPASARTAPPRLEEGLEVLDLPDGGEELDLSLGVDGAAVGRLRLLRRASRFSESDRARAREVAATVASAVARMELTARLRATQQWQTLGAFGRLLAHEIRNPLNSLSLQLQLVERSMARADDETRRGFEKRIESARQEMRRLDALVSDYLELHQVSGRLTFAHVDVDAVVTSVLRQERELLEQSRTRVETDLAPVCIEADGEKLSGLLVHLLHNAVEAMQGSAERRIDIRLTADDERVVLTVADTGPGLEQPREIFLPGYSKKPGGTGMGLAICRQIAEGHGGRLTATNGPQGGAELRLELPIRRSAET